MDLDPSGDLYLQYQAEPPFAIAIGSVLLATSLIFSPSQKTFYHALLHGYGDRGNSNPDML